MRTMHFSVNHFVIIQAFMKRQRHKAILEIVRGGEIASQEELMMMINLVMPRFFIPVHGEYRQLFRHAELDSHLMQGGLASTVADVLLDNGVCPKKFKRLGIPQIYAGFGSAAEQRAKYGYDKTAAIAAVRSMLK